MFGRQSDIMNDKSKKKSIIMALAVFIAIAAFASPLLMGDDNGDSNTVVLSGESLPGGYVNISTQEDIDSATENNLVLAADFTGSLIIPSGKSLYGMVPPNTIPNDLVGTPDGAKTITGTVTLEAGARLSFINIDGAVSICDNDVAVDNTTNTTIQYCSINAGTNVAISYLDIQAGNISIFSNVLSNKDTTNAILSFEGARDDVRSAKATSGTFNLDISGNNFSANKSRTFSGNDKVGSEYLGGSSISISGNTIQDAPKWGASIMFRALNENSELVVENNMISNSNKPELGLAGYTDNKSFADSNSYLSGLTTDANSLIIPANSVAVLSKDSELNFENITVLGTIIYDGSSISAVDGISTIKAGSLIINGELVPITDGKPIVVFGDVTLEGDLAGTLVILPAELDDAGNVLTKSNITLRNLNMAGGANIEYKLTVGGEPVTDSDAISNVSEIETNEAGEDVVISNSYEDRGVTVNVHDIEYNSEYQDAPVEVTQYVSPNNNIKALNAIYYYAPGSIPGSNLPVIYDVADYADGIAVNGISAGTEPLSGNVLGFTDLKVTNAGTYILIYTVSTSEMKDGKNVVDENFAVTFKVHQKVITEIDDKQIIKIYDTNTDVHSALTSIDIYEDDDVSFIAHYFSKNAGIWPVIIEGIDGNDAINYALSAKFDQSKYTTECEEECNCKICKDRSMSETCYCENCICNNYPVMGVILPKIITEDMIDVSKTYLSFNSNRIYPVITITLLDLDENGNPITIELDTSKMNNPTYDVPFIGNFVYEGEYGFDTNDFDEGIDFSYALNWTAMICDLNPNIPEFNNYIEGPLVLGAAIGYDKNATADEISGLLNSMYTMDWRNKPLTDVIGNTMFMTYYLADDLGENVTYALFDSSDNLIYDEPIDGGISEGIRAWYFSFDDQARYVEELVDGTYYLLILAGDSPIGKFDIEIKDSKIAGLYNAGYTLSCNSISEDMGRLCEYPPAWASKKAFEVTPGYIIKYHYIYNSSGLPGDEPQHKHIEQLINPMLLNMGFQYTISDVGVSPETMIFIKWTTLDINEVYGDCAIEVLDGQFSYSVNPIQVIDREFLTKYVDKDTGILNLYADYIVLDDPVDPEENKSINNIASGYKDHADDAKDYMLLYGVNANDVIDNTAWIIYDQKGYENSAMQGILYKLVDGELVEVFTEDLLQDDGRRAWYFSFNDQAKVDEIAGLYAIHIYADGEKVIEYTFEIYHMDYAVTVSADYAVDKETGVEGVRISIEPKEGSAVPDGILSLTYTHLVEGPFGLQTETVTTDNISIWGSDVTQTVFIPADGFDTANAVFEWESQGKTIYSLSNTITPYINVAA